MPDPYIVGSLALPGCEHSSHQPSNVWANDGTVSAELKGLRMQSFWSQTLAKTEFIGILIEEKALLRRKQPSHLKCWSNPYSPDIPIPRKQNHACDDVVTNAVRKP